MGWSWVICSSWHLPAPGQSFSWPSTLLLVMGKGWEQKVMGTSQRCHGRAGWGGGNRVPIPPWAGLNGEVGIRYQLLHGLGKVGENQVPIPPWAWQDWIGRWESDSNCSMGMAGWVGRWESGPSSSMGKAGLDGNQVPISPQLPPAVRGFTLPPESSFAVPPVSMQWILHGNGSQNGHGQELGMGCPWALLGTVMSEKV